MMYTSKANEMALVGHQSKNSHGDTLYVMAKRLLGYSIYIIATVQGVQS